MSETNSFSSTLGVDVPPIAIVDVGAMAEGADRYASLIDGGMATLVGFEPNAEQFDLLVAAAGPRRKYLPHCLGKGGPGQLHVTRYPGCTSLYRPDARVIDLFRKMSVNKPSGNFHVLRTEPVETRRLDDVEECPAPDYLKLDVQGAELDVLQGSERALASCLVVEAEVEFVPLYENQPLFADVDRFLRDHGFALHKMINIVGRAMLPFIVQNLPYAPISQVLWADAAFIRDFTRLEALADDQLLKTASILHHAYRSDDMAFHLLREYDLRSGTQTCEKFLAHLGTKGTEVRFMNVCT